MSRRSAAVAAAVTIALLALACSSGSGGDGGGGRQAAARRAPRGATQDSVQSAVDGADPWAVLGELSGTYTAHVTALANDCAYGPEFPFDGRGRGTRSSRSLPA